MAVVLLLAAAAAAEAKCVSETLEVTGRLIDEQGRFVSGALVVVRWPTYTGPQMSADATSRSDGTYRIAFQASTFSGEGPAGDNCEKKLATVTVDVGARGFRPASSTVEMLDGRARADFALQRAK